MTKSNHPKTNSQYLFVYGTLRPNIGHPMATYLAKHALWRGQAKAPGRLYDFGAYPGMIEARETNDWVIGDLYEMADPEKLLAELDKYEGCIPEEPQPYVFRRSVTSAITAEGNSLCAWIYYFVGDIDETQRVRSGDYQAVMESRRT